MITKTLYYSIYREEPFDYESECLKFEQTEYVKRKTELNKLCLREDLDEESEYREYTSYGPLFPELQLLKYFSLKPRELWHHLKKIFFFGNWYTIHTPEEHILFKSVIEKLIPEESEIPNMTSFPYTVYAATYQTDDKENSFILYDYEVSNSAIAILRYLKKEKLNEGEYSCK